MHRFLSSYIIISVIIYLSHSKTECGTNTWCYYIDIYPSLTSSISEQISIQNLDDTFDTYFDIYFTPRNLHCLSPSISFEFELIDYDAAGEYLEILNNDNISIQQCSGGSQDNCPNWDICLTNKDLGISYIEMDTSYKITIFEPAEVDAFCNGVDDHSYSINALLTMHCVSGSVSPTKPPSPSPTPLPTLFPTASPTFNPTTSVNPSQSPTDFPTFEPTIDPTLEPTSSDPTSDPTADPTAAPTFSPTKGPTTKKLIIHQDRPTKAPLTMDGAIIDVTETTEYVIDNNGGSSNNKGSEINSNSSDGFGGNLYILIASIAAALIICGIAIFLWIYCRKKTRVKNIAETNTSKGIITTDKAIPEHIRIATSTTIEMNRMEQVTSMSDPEDIDPQSSNGNIIMDDNTLLTPMGMMTMDDDGMITPQIPMMPDVMYMLNESLRQLQHVQISKDNEPEHVHITQTDGGGYNDALYEKEETETVDMKQLDDDGNDDEEDEKLYGDNDTVDVINNAVTTGGNEEEETPN